MTIDYVTTIRLSELVIINCKRDESKIFIQKFSNTFASQKARGMV